MPVNDITNSEATTTEEQVTQEVEEVLEPTVEETSVQEEQAKEEEKPLTPAQIKQIEMIASQIAARTAQSAAAKSENRIQKVIQSKFAALETVKDTLGLTPEQVKEQRQKIVTDAWASVDEQSAPEAQAQTNQEQPDAEMEYTEQHETAVRNQVNAAIQSAFNWVGTTVSKSDKEFASIEKAVTEMFTVNRNDPNAFNNAMKVVIQAATDKKSRVANAKEKAASRVVGAAGSTSSSSGLDINTPSSKLFAQASSEKKGG